MTFDDSWDVDYFDASEAQGHLLIVKVWDAPQYYRSQNNPDGMVYPVPGRSRFTDPFPNSVVRAVIVDLDVAEVDGSRGKIYPEAVIFPSSLTGTLKRWVNKPEKLLVWRKNGPRQTDPYELTNMAGNQQAVAIGKDYLARHPEFYTLTPPMPYDGHPPQNLQGQPPQQRAPQQNWNGGGQQQGGWNQGQPQQRPQGSGWGSDLGPQQPPQQPQSAQNGAWGQSDPWNGGNVAQQAPAAPQNSGWGSDTPSPTGGSFLAQAGAQNHWGTPQDEEPPF